MHTALGIGVGSLIEALLPKFNPGASLTTVAFETLVQVGLNGAALAMVGAYLQQDDPTFGIPFSTALLGVQPELSSRFVLLSAEAKERVGRAVQQTAAPALAVS